MRYWIVGAAVVLVYLLFTFLSMNRGAAKFDWEASQRNKEKS
jgi:hypothetical protein